MVSSADQRRAPYLRTRAMPGISPMNSRAKGIRGELEWRDYLRSRGYDEARRGQQYHGGGDSPDVVGVDGLHCEVKRTNRLLLYGAVAQATRDAADGCVPIVAHRPDRGNWLVILSADDFFDLWGERDALYTLAQKAVGPGLAAQIKEDAHANT